MESNLLKVIIVDDEPIFREYLISRFDWQSIGLEVCGQANNGVAALEQALEIKPDIALVDINMPYMDGLTLSEKLMHELPKVQVVLITGYSEFEYARKALKIGVMDYILKPFEDEELKKILLKVKENINKSAEEEKIASISAELRREKLLNSLLNNEIYSTNDELSAEFKALGIEFCSSFLIVAVIEIDNLYENLNFNTAEQILFRKNNVLETINEIFIEDNKPLVISGFENRIVCVIEMDKYTVSDKGLKERFEKMCRKLQRESNFTITVGVGKLSDSYSDIRASYLSALAALQNKLILGGNKVIEYNTLGETSFNVGFYSNEISEAIIMSLRKNDFNTINEKLEEIFNYMIKNKLSIDYACGICNGLVSLCLSFVMEAGYEIKIVFGEDFSPFSDMKKKESIGALLLWLKELFQSVVRYVNKHKQNKPQKIVKEVKQYIDSNYSDCDLSLEAIAGKMYMNSDYLRAVFRKVEGRTINEHITYVRMHKAKELICQGNIKLIQVSDAVGYNDESYFSKSFKKFFGISPSEYKSLKNN